MKQGGHKQKNWPLLGNEHIVNYLAGLLEKGGVEGSYIFLGPEDLGKGTLANYFSKNILCEKEGGEPCGECPSCRQMRRLKTTTKKEEGQEEGFEVVHGDFHVIKKEEGKKNISIEQIRGLTDALSKSSFLNSYKVGIIKRAETLSIEAANALLKTLEEPNAKVVIILIASDPGSIPETISSRSQTLNFYPVNTDAIHDHLVGSYNISRTNASHIAHLSLGRPALAVKMLEDKEFYEEHLFRARAFVDFFRQDINARFSGIQNMIGERSEEKDPQREAVRVLEIWRGVVRDLLLSATNNKHLLQHKMLSEELEKLAYRINFDHLLGMNSKLSKGKQKIKANVNPRLVLEDIVCNI